MKDKVLTGLGDRVYRVKRHDRWIVRPAFTEVGNKRTASQVQGAFEMQRVVMK